MDPVVWHRSKEVFDACLDLDSLQRPAYLEKACGNDGALRREVESLLASHERAGDFLLQPVLRESFIGTRLGHWKVIADIGEGGMSRVCLAERADGVFEQRAAVKILKRGMDTDQILRHFQMERQILAGMRHPNIARLLDGGVTPDGRPYFVMEHIEGEAIHLHAEKHSLDERLRLFQQVCSAAHYAHQRLVVHRDIKPGNILVTTDGVAKLLDFGIATIVSPDLGVGTIGSAGMLTPEYASPEQARGEPVTTASDVYSLGVLLSKLLSGAGGDPRNIAEKAMEQDPQRRYSSAEQLSLDIENYLEGRPVLAKPHTASYRASRFVARNKLGVAAAALVMVSLIGGAAATLWQAKRAEENFFETRQLANSMLFELHDAIRDLPGATKARSLVVQRSLKYLDRMSKASPADAPLRIETAEGYKRLGDVQGRPGEANLGDRAAAEASYQKAIALLTDPVSDTPLDRRRKLTLARVLIRLGGFEKVAHARELLEGLRPEGDRTVLGELATCEGALARLLRERGDMQNALLSFENVLRLRRQILDADPQSPTATGNLALASKLLGGHLWKVGRKADAMSNYQAALRLEEDWLRREPSNGEAKMAASYSHSDIAFLLSGENRFSEALAHFRTTVKIREDLAALDPDNAHATVSLVSAYWRTANVCVSAGERHTALDLLKKAEARLASARKPEPGSPPSLSELAWIYSIYGELSTVTGDSRAAKGWFGKSKDVCVSLRKVGALDANGEELLRSMEERLALPRSKP